MKVYIVSEDWGQETGGLVTIEVHLDGEKAAKRVHDLNKTMRPEYSSYGFEVDEWEVITTASTAAATK